MYRVKEGKGRGADLGYNTYHGISAPMPYMSNVVCTCSLYFMYDLYFNQCVMISCVGFFLRSSEMVSYLVMKVINIGFDLITLLNNKKIIILSRYTMGGHNCPSISVFMNWVKSNY
jgi:hypothetical protein